MGIAICACHQPQCCGAPDLAGRSSCRSPALALGYSSGSLKMNTSKGWKAGPRKPQHSEYETAAPGTTLPPEQAAAIRDWMMGRPFDQARRGLVVLLAGERV